MPDPTPPTPPAPDPNPAPPPAPHSSVYDREPDEKQFGNKDYWKLLRDENGAQRMRRKAAEADALAAKTAAEKVAKDAEERVTAAA